MLFVIKDWLKRHKSTHVSEDIGKFGMWVNDNIVGNAFTFVLAILAVFVVYAAIPFVGGYTSWNTGLGLFFNTLSSSFELITGIGAVVGVVVLHRKVKNHIGKTEQHHADLLDMHETHAREVAALHEKFDQHIATSNSVLASPPEPVAPAPTPAPKRSHHKAVPEKSSVTPQKASITNDKPTTSTASRRRSRPGTSLRDAASA